jgi:hypothetical protein
MIIAGERLGTHRERLVLTREGIMSSTSTRYTDQDRAVRLLRAAAATVGAVFLVVGILGFVPGITTNADDITFAGHESPAKLLDIFQVSVLHNLVHIAFGIAGLVLARQARTAAAYLIGGGVIYLVLWLYGLLVERNGDANFVPVNEADDWLHFVLGLGMIALGLLGRRALDRHRTTRDGRYA